LVHRKAPDAGFVITLRVEEVCIGTHHSYEVGLGCR
jgi:hypothetical protein